MMHLTNRQRLKLIEDVAIIRTRVECLPTLKKEVSKNTVFRYVTIGMLTVIVISFGIFSQIVDISKIWNVHAAKITKVKGK